MNNILHLKYAVEIEKTGSITKAAENLYMGQPNLSPVSYKHLDVYTRQEYRLVSLPETPQDGPVKAALIGPRLEKTGLSALVRREDAQRLGLPCVPCDLENAMIHLEKEA